MIWLMLYFGRHELIFEHCTLFLRTFVAQDDSPSSPEPFLRRPNHYFFVARVLRRPSNLFVALVLSRPSNFFVAVTESSVFRSDRVVSFQKWETPPHPAPPQCRLDRVVKVGKFPLRGGKPILAFSCCQGNRLRLRVPCTHHCWWQRIALDCVP